MCRSGSASLLGSKLWRLRGSGGFGYGRDRRDWIWLRGFAAVVGEARRDSGGTRWRRMRREAVWLVGGKDGSDNEMVAAMI